MGATGIGAGAAQCVLARYPLVNARKLVASGDGLGCVTEVVVVDEPVVLVVDDSPTVRKIVQLTLQREHIRVVTAGDGLTGLASVSDELPDVILLDIMLPHMDGYNICQIIRRNMSFRDLPIIMLSGKDGLFDKMRGKLAGSTEYITKPFDSSELVQTVKRYLNSPAVAERAAQRAQVRQRRVRRV